MIAPLHSHRVLLDATRVQVPGRQDFTIPPPRGDVPRTDTPRAVTTRTETLAAAGNPFARLERAATRTEMLLGGSALLVCAVIFLFVRQGVRIHLINRRATLDAADGASWMLFAALLLTALILVGAAVGRFWQAWAGLTAGLSLCVILFAIALVLFLRASDRRR